MELSIVLLILSIILLGLIGVYNYDRTTSAQEITNRRMEAIENALIGFVAANGRLPCPAVWGLGVTEEEFGYESATQSSNLLSCSSNMLINSIQEEGFYDTIYLGMPPIYTLGLGLEYSFDGYGNRFGYVAGTSATNSSILTEINLNVDATNPNCDPSSEESFINCFAQPITQSGFNRIDILEQSGGNLITAEAVYVLISYGENGSGSFPRAADQTINGASVIDGAISRNPYSESDDELENLDCDGTSGCGQQNLNLSFVQKIRDQNFDDTVRFDTRNGMITKCNQFSNNICSNQTTGHSMLLDI